MVADLKMELYLGRLLELDTVELDRQWLQVSQKVELNICYNNGNLY